MRSALTLWLQCSRSEEHTSELQSQSNLVCRLLLEKKKRTAVADWRTSRALEIAIPCLEMARTPRAQYNNHDPLRHTRFIMSDRQHIDTYYHTFHRVSAI